RRPLRDEATSSAGLDPVPHQLHTLALRLAQKEPVAENSDRLFLRTTLANLTPFASQRLASHHVPATLPQSSPASAGTHQTRPRWRHVALPQQPAHKG